MQYFIHLDAHITCIGHGEFKILHLPCVDDPKIVMRRFWLVIEGEGKVSVPIIDIAIASVSIFL